MENDNQNHKEQQYNSMGWIDRFEILQSDELNLDEVSNEVNGTSTCSFEPSINYG